ncbi:MAG: adenosine deaminase [bacterium]|nr:adenosine deaminase [bacterium]
MSGTRIELHTHLEGALTPQRLVTLAERHGQPGVPAACLNAAGDAYVHEGFQGFLRLFRDATSLLRTPDDFRAVAGDLGNQLAADGVAYAEVTVSFGVLLRRGIPPRSVMEALADEAARVGEEQGVVLRWIPDAVRQWGLDAAWRAWEAAAGCGRELGVVGFGLGGDEAAGPAADFAAVFAEVRAEGLGVTIHAGEVTAMGDHGRRSVRDAVEICGARRIGHGTAAGADPALLELLAARGVHVEACPGSNLATGAVACPADHPLRVFLDTGVSCSLNTDDRAFFGLDLESEFASARTVFGLTEAEEAGLTAAARVAVFDRQAYPDSRACPDSP